ncbi:hypothetical protein Pmani_028107 [Petrolisthes manimaculis]|uniref:Uncharacterized protein n=1 Tax=Petrolisthes manimaculis TaxID=1843537 RepID=A0AAE1P1E8_9EUCA|nr:hypothetical protein Pmani_028107 [Petrolisthes manimaculis]
MQIQSPSTTFTPELVTCPPSTTSTTTTTTTTTTPLLQLLSPQMLQTHHAATMKGPENTLPASHHLSCLHTSLFPAVVTLVTAAPTLP